MKYPWLRDYCNSMKGAIEEYKPEWDVMRYMIGDKMFAMIGEDKEGREILTVKLAPEHGEFLRSSFADIRPGHYMNKVHWNSLDLNGSIPDNVIMQAVGESYGLVFMGLSNKKREEIMDGNQG